MPSFIGWVPTPADRVDAFFELAPVTSEDVVYDLGSGDGRLVFAALAQGAGKAVGVELDPEHFRHAEETARNQGFVEKASFVNADVMKVNLAAASLVLCYLYPTASRALRPKLERELRPGSRVVMETFAIPGWKPSRQIEKGYTSFYLYVMPPEKTAEYWQPMDNSDIDTDYYYG
ncbi:MAG: methyltransferase domain-containing protein [Chloroflexota bacterium]